ncbi:terminase [Streptomyces sp. NPDC056707]|uniref:terminase n=1 Tax=Streptomyces sp. NPDC056707 TaxID=3345919 RepID=UPI0036A30775
MTSSTLAANAKAAGSAVAPDPLVGSQTPRILSAPLYRHIETGRWNGLEDQEALDFRSPSGQEAVELAADSGLELDPWQQLSLHHSLAEDREGLWLAFEVVLNICRQNGKGGWLEARQLAGVMLFGDKLIIHTAHQFKTAQESFLRLDQIISGSTSLSRRVKRIVRSHGEEGFEFFNGARIRFLARSAESGRGFSGDTVIMDEAMKLRSDPIGALLPVMSARRNPQLLYTCSAGLGPESEQLATLRARALADTEQPDPSLAYLEWSIAEHVKECPHDEQGRITCTEHDDRHEPRSWARANPALGIRIRPAHVGREMATMRPDLFDRERLGVGDYPATAEDTWSVIDKEAWQALADAESQPSDPVAFCIDVTPERSYTSIGVAGEYGNGAHLEVVENRPGVDWVVDRAAELDEKWDPRVWIVDASGPAGSLIEKLQAKGLTVVSPKAREMAQACGQLYDAVAASEVTHLDQAPLTTALAGAKKRDLGDAWAWARKSAGIDISPLVAVTLAKWGLSVEVEEEEEEVEPWAEYG